MFEALEAIVKIKPKLRRIFELDGGRCRYCGLQFKLEEYGRRGGWTIDHVVAKIRGGSNHEDNLVVCCLPCNMLKSDLSVDEFRLKVRNLVATYSAFIDRYTAFAEVDNGEI